MKHQTYEEQRRSPRKLIPEGIVCFIEILNEENNTLFKAPIVDISTLGAGIYVTHEMNQLLISLKVIKNFIFHKCQIVSGRLVIHTGIIWVWNNEGKSGIQFFGISEMDLKSLEKFVNSLPETK